MQTPSTAIRLASTALLLTLPATTSATAQDRPLSPPGVASTQLGDHWIDVSYSRPILRGRENIFGSGEEYGQQITANAPLWRVGANVTTRIKTEADLEINGVSVPAGEYSFFIDLHEGAWTGVISTQPYMESFDRERVAEGITWGAYGYSPEHDVVRAPMTVTSPDMQVDQMTIFFADCTEAGGYLGVVWGNQMGMLEFKVAGQGEAGEPAN